MGAEGFEPPNPKERFYRPSQLTIVAALPFDKEITTISGLLNTTKSDTSSTLFSHCKKVHDAFSLRREDCLPPKATDISIHKTISPFLRHSRLANRGYFNLMLLDVDYFDLDFSVATSNALSAVHRLFGNIIIILHLAGTVGLEPTTYWLTVNCANHCAKCPNVLFIYYLGKHNPIKLFAFKSKLPTWIAHTLFQFKRYYKLSRQRDSNSCSHLERVMS